MTKTAVAELMKNFKLSDLVFSAKWFLIYDYNLL